MLSPPGVQTESSRSQQSRDRWGFRYPQRFVLQSSMGRGQVIAFAEDPNYRAYTEATMLLFMNAVLLGPGR